MSNEEMKLIYLEAGSLKKAGLILGIDQWKLRKIRDILGWPKLNLKYRVKAEKLGPRRPGSSIYDHVGEPVLTKEQLDMVI